MSVRSLCNKAVTVQAMTETADVYGTQTEAFATRHSNVPIRIQPMKGTESMEYRKQNVDVSHKAFIPLDLNDYSDIEETDQIVDGTKTYHIVLVRNIDEMEHHLELVLRRLKDKN